MATPQLYYKHGGIAELIMQKCPELKLPFSPTIWAPDPHTQSAMGMLRILTARGSYTRQLVMTSDHGTLGLDWWCGSDKATWAAPEAPIVLFIHGINGGSHEGYVKWACVAAANRGWRAVVLNMRGCNGLPLTSARGYNAIITADVHVAVQSIHSRFPDAPLMAAGYSLGSVLLAKYLAEADNGLYNLKEQGAGSSGSSSSSGGGSVPEPSTGSGLVAAALVSPPVCLHTTNSKMGRPYTTKFMYNLLVAYKLREYVKEHSRTMHTSGMNIDTEAMLNSWTVASFDDAVTLKALGYPSPHLYYRHACSTNYIPHIRTPTLILLSKDDPFLGIIPQEQVQHNPFTLMAATRRGGHLAFLQGWWPLGQSYCDTVIDGWLSAALQEWRHGSSIHHPQAAAAAGSAIPSDTGAAVLRSLRQQEQQAQGRRQQQLPSWVQRAVGAGQLDPSKQFDPTTLANILCTCNRELRDAEPVDQAHAVDAVLNTATAPAATVAAAAGKAATAAARQQGGPRTSSSSSSAKYSWLFGFGRGAASPSAPTTTGSAVPGLRGEGAWEPFGAADSGPEADGLAGVSTTGGAGADEGPKAVPPPAAPSRWGGWWGGRAGTQAASGSQPSGPAQLRSRL